MTALADKVTGREAEETFDLVNAANVPSFHEPSAARHVTERTLDQAEGLDGILTDLDMELDAVLVFRVPDEVLIKRLSGRRSCPECKALFNIYFDPPEVAGVCDVCGAKLVERADDTADTVKKRLQVYKRQTRPLIEYYQKTPTRVEFVAGDQPVTEVQESIQRALLPA